MLWGYALGWFPQFLTEDPDPLMAKLKFLKKWNFKVTGLGSAEAAKISDAELDRIGEYLRDQDLYLHIYSHVNYMDPDLDLIKRQVEEQLSIVDRVRERLRTPLITTGVGSYHRFMRAPSFSWQMERLAIVLPWLATGFKQMGLPFGIENHGDYYVSDIVTLCKEIDNLGLFLDTGNTYLIGEAPLPAFEIGAPYVVGTHFKDQRVRPRPETSPLQFEVGNEVTGEGDVPLRECYKLLWERNPHPEKIVMEIEFFPPPGVDPADAIERIVPFIHSLEK